MTEINQVRAVVRRKLAPFGRLQRIESPLTGLGIPDFLYSLRGVAGVLECKLIPPSGRCPETFTREQLMWGEEWVAPPSSGRWHLLGLWLKPAPEWVLMDARGARQWFEGTILMAPPPHPAMWAIGGRFPARELLAALTATGREL